MKPGEIVQYLNQDPQRQVKPGPYPALVVSVADGSADLVVFGMGTGATLVHGVDWPQKAKAPARAVEPPKPPRKRKVKPVDPEG